MRELGYVRNFAARALRSQRSHMIGVLIPTLDYAIYARLVGAANERFSAAGISTLIATFDYDLDAEPREARLLLERGAEALVLVGDHHRPELHELLSQFGVPFVNTYVFDPKSTLPTVGFDNAMAAAELALHANPPLTTIEVPAQHMGSSAAAYLLSRLKGDELPIHHSVDVQLILRKSTAPPAED